jgi:hypothetical protein
MHPLEHHVAIALLARRAAELLEALLHFLAGFMRHEGIKQPQGGGAAACPDTELVDRFLPVLVRSDALQKVEDGPQANVNSPLANAADRIGRVNIGKPLVETRHRRHVIGGLRGQKISGRNQSSRGRATLPA